VWQSVITKYFYALFFSGCAPTDEGQFVGGEVEKRKRKKNKSGKTAARRAPDLRCSLLQNYWR